MKDILWVADFGLKHNSGGAQRTDSFMLNELRASGFSVTEFNHDGNPEVFNRSYDIVVSGNLEVLSRSPDIMNYLIRHPNHIRFEHDSNSYLKNDQRKMLFGSTKKNIFLSDFHHSTFVELYGDIFPNATVCVSPIDTSKFCNTGWTVGEFQSRIKGTLSIGFMHNLKGTQRFFAEALRNRDKDFYYAGWGDPFYTRSLNAIPNIKNLGKVEYEKIPELLNSYTDFFYHPLKFEPFCRSVAEAILCGMHVDCGENVGSLHHFRKVGKDQFIKDCKDSPKRFVELVTNG